jgi:hypothetical protein
MQISLSFAAALGIAVITLGGCAATQAPQAAVAASGNYFCHEQSLATSGASHTCNWSTNARDVCEDLVPATTLAAADLATAPARAQRCNTGRWLVQVARK